MTHLWVRAEQRDNEQRVGLTPQGAGTLLAQGIKVTVETSPTRVIPDTAYEAVGCKMAKAHSWPEAPDDAIIFGLKELPDNATPLHHKHIMFGHAFKGQSAGRRLLDRFNAGGGTLLDLEYLTDAARRRVAAFGYWAGFAGAAVSLQCWLAQHAGGICPAITPSANAATLIRDLKGKMGQTPAPDALVIGALGRVGRGVTDLCHELSIAVTPWDMAETAHGGPFPEILDHQLFFNCILAGPDTPVFVAADAGQVNRNLRVIGDIACDPDSVFNPIKVYDRATTWEAPALRAYADPPLDVMAIDNLPSLLPLESSEDYAAQLLPTLAQLSRDEAGVWARAQNTFARHRDGV